MARAKPPIQVSEVAELKSGHIPNHISLSEPLLFPVLASIFRIPRKLIGLQQWEYVDAVEVEVRM